MTRPPMISVPRQDKREKIFILSGGEQVLATLGMAGSQERNTLFGSFWRQLPNLLVLVLFAGGIRAFIARGGGPTRSSKTLKLLKAMSKKLT